MTNDDVVCDLGLAMEAARNSDFKTARLNMLAALHAIAKIELHDYNRRASVILHKLDLINTGKFQGEKLNKLRTQINQLERAQREFRPLPFQIDI